MKFYHLASSLLVSSFLAVPAMAQSAEWTGPYVGAYVDAAYDEVGVEDFNCWTACTKPTIEGTGFKAGATIGYDAQVGDTLVLGLVADAGTGSRRHLVQGAAIGMAGVGTFSYESDVDVETSVRARAGIVHGDSLIYLTGGVAWTKGRFTAGARNVPLYLPSHSSNYAAIWSGTATGPTFGGGIEHRFGSVSARLEVLHKRHAPVSACFANTDAPNPGQCWQDRSVLPPQVNYTFSVTSMRLGVNFRF